MTDTTLFALFPAVPEMVGGEALEIRPVVLGEIPLVQRAQDGWRALVATSGAILPLESWHAFLSLLASSCGHSRAWVEALPEADFERLISLVMAQNRELWAPETEENDESMHCSWAQVAQRLASHGHAWSEVKTMTLEQARAFLREAAVLERESLAQGITAASFSQADGKTVQSAVKELRRG